MKVTKKQKKKISHIILWGWQYWDIEEATRQIVEVIEKKRK